MITGKEAINRSVLKFCANNEVCIAFGDGTNFSKYYLGNVPTIFDAQDEQFWLVDKSLKPEEKPANPGAGGDTSSGTGTGTGSGSGSGTGTGDDEVRSFKSITISGEVDLDRYTELFAYFIAPFVMTSNKVEIKVDFKVFSTAGNQLNESSAQYKSAKEAAKQLNLDFDTEENK